MGTNRVRGVFLVEALVSLAILGIVLTLGAGFLARRRVLERNRLDHERAVRAAASEWIYLRSSFRTDVDGLYLVHLEIGYGEKMARRIVQEGYVFRGAGPPP